MLSFCLRLCLPSGLSSSEFPAKSLYRFRISPLRATCTTRLLLLEFIFLIYGEEYELRSPDCAVFPVPLLLPFSQVRMFSLAFCFQTPRIRILPIE
jgi:hypothetical protein